MRTVEAVMKARGPATSGFDYLRLLLAISVLCIHSIATSYGRPAEAFLFAPPLKGLISGVLPMFFALSGFLVAGSYQRTRKLLPFVSFRVLRIVPALSVEVLLSAILLGPVFTTLPLSRYFTDPLFWSYFGNAVGWIHYLLPGVFMDNPFNTAVNVSLWTVPYELECYLGLIILALIGLLERRKLLVMALAALALFIVGRDMVKGVELPIDGALPARLLLMSFLCGVALYIFKEKVPMNGALIVAAGVLSFLMLNTQWLPYLAPLPVAYFTVGLGLLNPPRTFVVSTGDYSYGVYLYAFPMQQMFAHLFPQHREWYFNIMFALPASVAFAVLSWHMVEKRCLLLKRYVAPRRATPAGTTPPPAASVSGRPSAIAHHPVETGHLQERAP